MPSYYDEKTKTWYCQFYYQEYTGERKKKKKRGFERKKDAQDWERNFLLQKQGNTDITFENFAQIYFDDMRLRLRESSINNKEWTYTHKIAPYFKDKKIKDITPADVRHWQGELLNSGSAPTYCRMINAQFSSIMNYAVRYYGLAQNPVKIAGTIGKASADRMEFYTYEEFKQFIAAIGDKEPARTGFTMLYFTGMRIGELLALTSDDFDVNTNTVSINKTYKKIGKEDIISQPKTEKGTRTITIPPFLMDMVQAYMGQIYALSQSDRLFSYSRHYFTHEVKRAAESANIKRIRVHDFRHSHVALLIELGFNPLLISERLGHENVETTLNTYGHLYPNKQGHISDKLQELEPK